MRQRQLAEQTARQVRRASTGHPVVVDTCDGVAPGPEMLPRSPWGNLRSLKAQEWTVVAALSPEAKSGTRRAVLSDRTAQDTKAAQSGRTRTIMFIIAATVYYPTAEASAEIIIGKCIKRIVGTVTAFIISNQTRATWRRGLTGAHARTLPAYRAHQYELLTSTTHAACQFSPPKNTPRRGEARARPLPLCQELRRPPQLAQSLMNAEARSLSSITSFSTRQWFIPIVRVQPLLSWTPSTKVLLTGTARSLWFDGRAS